MKRAEPRYPGGGGGPSMSGAGGGYGGGSKNYGQGFNQGQFKLQCTKAAFLGMDCKCCPYPLISRRGVNHYCKVYTLLKFVAQCLCL